MFSGVYSNDFTVSEQVGTIPYEVSYNESDLWIELFYPQLKMQQILVSVVRHNEESGVQESNIVVRSVGIV